MKHVDEVAKNVIPPFDGSKISPHPERRVRRVTLDQLDTGHHPMVAKAVMAARAWASRKIGGMESASLVLVASPVRLANGSPDPDRTGYGCGKTHVAKAVMWSSYYHLDDGEPIAPVGKFFVAKDILDLLAGENTMVDLVPAGTDTIHGRIGGTPVVVIDDVGAEGVLPYVARELQEHELRSRYFEIFNYLYECKISAVVTANLTLDELAAHVGGRAWSRLLEMAPTGFMIDLTGVPDYRRIQGGR